MKRLILITLLTLIAATANATIVSLDLFDLGCLSSYDPDSGSDYWWTSDFDLGVSFSSISAVYVDWSGEITGGMVSKPNVNGGVPYPEDVSIYTFLSLDITSHTDIWTGAATYPESESFGGQYEILAEEWSDLLDGTDTIYLGYSEYIMLNGSYTEHGSIALDSAVLIVDGTIVPEPATISLLAFGTFIYRRTLS